MKPKITVATSVYNTEEYLPRCLDSIINQTLKDIEIIVINDGSPGNAIEIIKEFEKKDERVIVFDTENQGVSKARNLSLEKAKGEYIVFVDSDDYLEHDMLAALYDEVTSTKSDIAICNIRRVFDEYCEPPFFTMPKQRIIDVPKGDSTLISQSLTGEMSIGLCVYNKLYKVDFLKESKVIFEERDEIYAEDGFFHFSILKHVKRICIVDRALYNYYQHDKSVSYNYKENLPERCANFISRLETLYADANLKTALANRSYIFLIEILHNEVYHKGGCKAFRGTIKDEFFWEWTAYLKVGLLSRNQKIVYYLYRFKMNFLVYILFYLSVKGVI